MKYLILSLFLGLSQAFALDAVRSVFSGDVKTDQKSERQDDGLDKISILMSSQKIKYMKNPCFNEKGYRFRTIRGFGFESGVVKKFKADGMISYDNNNGKSFDSLYTFLNSKKACAPINKSYPAKQIDFDALEIWH